MHFFLTSRCQVVGSTLNSLEVKSIYRLHIGLLHFEEVVLLSCIFIAS